MFRKRRGLLLVQDAWWESHETWWVHPPSTMEPGDVGFLEGVEWKGDPKKTGELSLPKEVTKTDLSSGIWYTHATLSWKLEGQGSMSPAATFFLAGIPLGTKLKGGAKRAVNAGAVISAKKAQRRELENYPGIKERLKQTADSGGWSPEALVVTSVRKAISAQERTHILSSNSKIEAKLSGNIPVAAKGNVAGEYVTKIYGGASETCENEGSIDCTFLCVDKKWWRWKVVPYRDEGLHLPIWGVEWNVPSSTLAKMSPDEVFVNYTWSQMVASIAERRSAAIKAGVWTASLMGGAIGLSLAGRSHDRNVYGDGS